MAHVGLMFEQSLRATYTGASSLSTTTPSTRLMQRKQSGIATLDLVPAFRGMFSSRSRAHHHIHVLSKLPFPVKVRGGTFVQRKTLSSFRRTRVDDRESP